MQKEYKYKLKYQLDVQHGNYSKDDFGPEDGGCDHLSSYQSDLMPIEKSMETFKSIR